MIVVVKSGQEINRRKVEYYIISLFDYINNAGYIYCYLIHVI